MLSRFFRRLSIKVFADGHKIRFSVPMLSVLEPMNDLVDLLTLIAFVFPFLKVHTEKGKRYGIRSVLPLIKSGEVIFAEFLNHEPFDFVDVATKDAVVKISLI